MKIHIQEIATILGPTRTPMVEVRQPAPTVPSIVLTPTARQILRESRAALATAPIERLLVFSVSADGKLVGLSEQEGDASHVAVDFPQLMAEIDAFTPHGGGVYAMHNHPMCGSEPSEADRLFTTNLERKLTASGRLLLHHEIVAGKPPEAPLHESAPPMETSWHRRCAEDARLWAHYHGRRPW